MGRVAGKVALVAGAGGGIGGAGAEALAREDAAVFCTDLDGSAAESTAACIRAAGGQATASALDVRDRVAVDAAVAAVVREFGRLDIVLEIGARYSSENGARQGDPRDGEPLAPRTAHRCESRGADRHFADAGG